jgi:3-dehydroquinate dehydratase / shikimate dehydrogenase
MQLRNEARIAVSITLASWSDALAAIARAAPIADLIEIRLDYLKDRNPHLDAEEILGQAITESSRPIIFTHRSGRPESAPNRTAQNKSRLIGARKEPLGRDYFDFDLQADNSVGLHLYNTYVRLFGTHPQIILSHHDFNKCDEKELTRIYKRFAVFNPDITKIAAQAERIDDLLAIFNLLDKAKSDKRALIALAMGSAGRISRILGPGRGSFLTFASLEQGAESAPGQFTIDEMLSLYRVKSITDETSIYGILGNPVDHSVSPHMHNAAFAALGLDAVYLPIALTPNELSSFIEKFAHPSKRAIRWSFRGASVTVPHKVRVAEMLDEVDPTAKDAGAVNTIVVDGERLRGYNTDIAGAIRPLEQLLDLRGAEAAVLGAGGAARAVVKGLCERGARVTIYGRDAAKRERLAEEFKIEARSFDEASEMRCDLLINTTPIGMRGWQSEVKIPIKPEALARCGLVYDLVYNPIETELLREARERGARTLGGLEMLIAQAAEQFELWTGISPPIDVMRAAAMKRLNGASANSPARDDR